MKYTEKNINVVQVSNVQSAAVKELFRGVLRHSLTSFCALYQFLIPQESAATIRKIKAMHRLFNLLDLNYAR